MKILLDFLVSGRIPLSGTPLILKLFLILAGGWRLKTARVINNVLARRELFINPFAIKINMI
jgi:hypothetical protein